MSELTVRSKRGKREGQIQKLLGLLRETDDTGVNIVFRSAQSAAEDFPINKQAESSQ